MMFILFILQAMKSLDKIKWPQDIERKESGTPGGRGIFMKKPLLSGDCCAAYWGHLVDHTGLIQIKCEATSNLMIAVPDARQVFSKAHCVCVSQQPLNLYVDGSHHTGTKYDGFNNRNGIPWGACLNSSQFTGTAANCELRWLPSPAFESIREASKQLGNGNNLQVKYFSHHFKTL